MNILRTFVPAFFTLALMVQPSFSHGGHEHEYHAVEAKGAPAVVDFQMKQNQDKTWTVSVVTEKFIWAPELVDADHIDNTGHAHLLIDGVKLVRLDAQTQIIEALPFGPHDMQAVLFTNNHAEYTIAGMPIARNLTITVE